MSVMAPSTIPPSTPACQLRNALTSVATLIGLALVFSQGVAGQVVNQRVIDSRGNEQLLGQLTEEALSSPPFRQWYTRSLDAYQPDKTVLSGINNLRDYEIEVFMGTWCSDSQREVPRLMRILRELRFPRDQLAIVGVNRTTNQLKQSPNGEEAGKNIHRVPTIIFYKDGEEVSRIVESPIATLEQDVKTITAPGQYTPNYQIVAELDELLVRNGPSFVAQQAEAIAGELKLISRRVSELDVYGHVQLSQHSVDKAVAIFEVNRALFPYEAAAYEGLAAAHYEQGNYAEAKANCLELLKLQPENEVARQMLADIAAK